MTAVMTKTVHPVAPRKTDFDLGSAPVHWLDGDPQSTHTLNVGNLLFPTGERFFNDSLRNALPYVTDEEVRRQIRGFLGQEVTHANEHERCVERMHEHGIDFSRPLKRFEALRRRLNARVDSLPEPLRRQAVLLMLAATAAAEHLTASLAGYVLEDNSWSDIDVDPEMRHLFLWHAAEEVEHRHVAYDVYHHVGGGYLRRVATMLPIGLLILVAWPLLTTEIMRRDPHAKGIWSWRKHLTRARRGDVFSLPRAVWDIRLYLKTDHHPADLPGSLDLALEYLESAPSVVGYRGRRS
ncbi:MAG: metal-dependent hydrolase [Acidimicrobiales bacterium]|nr:metal-dependent hydrolase [Acidimicrobiales bacterium]